MKLKFFIFALLLFLSSFLQAGSILKDWSDGYAVTYLIDNDRWDYVVVDIDYSSKGFKMLVFRLVPSDTNQACQLNYSSSNTDITFIVDGQAIRGGVQCKRFTNSGNTFYDIWAYSNNGANYIVNRFRRSPDKVSISTRLLDFDVSAIGFTAEWNRTGGNAL